MYSTVERGVATVKLRGPDLKGAREKFSSPFLPLCCYSYTGSVLFIAPDPELALNGPVYVWMTVYINLCIDVCRNMHSFSLRAIL